jgi:hypothetical protein
MMAEYWHPTPAATEQLAAQFPAIDALVRAGETEEAARGVDEVLGQEHTVLWRAYLAFRTRRLGRRRASAA